MAFVPSRPRAFAAACLCVCFLLWPMAARADEAPVYSLDDVSVTASPPAASSPSANSSIDEKELASRGIKTVADAVQALSGAAVVSHGPEGSQATVSIRASTSNEVLVLVNGVPVNTPLSELADLSGIPIDAVDRVEVLNGSAALAYGADAIGGVINIVLKGRAQGPRITLENGSYIPSVHVEGYGFSKVTAAADPLSLLDSQKLGFSWLPVLGTATLRSSASLVRAANAYTFLDSNGDNRVLQNAGLLSAAGSLGLDAPLFDGKFSAEVAGDYDDKGVPGPQSAPTLGAHQNDASAHAAFNYLGDRFFTDALNFHLSGFTDYQSVDYRDGANAANNGRHGVLSSGASLEQNAAFSDAVGLAYGLSFSYATAWSSDLGSPERLKAGIYLAPSFELGPLSLVPTIRYDYYSDFFARDPLAAIGAGLSATLRVSQGDRISLDLARAYRAPSFEDLYWPSEAGAAGNPGLKPETAYSAELAWVATRENFQYSAKAFVRYAKDVILWQAGNDAIWRPSNFGAALYPGLEQSLNLRFDTRYRLAVNYSYMRSYVLDEGFSLSDDKRLPMTPEHDLSLNLAYEGSSVSWSWAAHYVSSRFTTVGNVGFLPSYFVLGGNFRVSFSKVLLGYLAVDNAFGEQYEVVDSYPMPGFKVRTGLEITF